MAQLIRTHIEASRKLDPNYKRRNYDNVKVEFHGAKLSFQLVKEYNSHIYNHF